MANEQFQDAEKWLPGVVGSAGMLLWIKGSWPRRIAMVLLGSAASYWGAPHIAEKFAMGEGLAGFLVGVFGMSIVDSLFRTWQELDLTAIMREFLRARLGLPPKGGE